MSKEKERQSDSSDVEEHRSAATEADIEKYWSEANQEAACPVPFPLPKDPKSPNARPASSGTEKTK
jgi:hypothetical protein